MEIILRMSTILKEEDLVDLQNRVNERMPEGVSVLLIDCRMAVEAIKDGSCVYFPPKEGCVINQPQPKAELPETKSTYNAPNPVISAAVSAATAIVATLLLTR